MADLVAEVVKTFETLGETKLLTSSATLLNAGQPLKCAKSPFVKNRHRSVVMVGRLLAAVYNIPLPRYTRFPADDFSIQTRSASE